MRSTSALHSGFIYHRNHRIHSVTMRRDDQLGSDCIEVDAQIALDLLAGKTDPDSIYVFDGRLLSGSDMKSAFLMDGEWTPVEADRPIHPVVLRAEIGKRSRKLVFTTEHSELTNTTPLPFIVAAKDDPANVLAGGVIPHGRLREGHVVSLPRIDNIDVWLPRLKAAKPWVRLVEHGEVPLPRGPDYVLVGETNTEPGLRVSVAHRQITLGLHDGGGVRFRRNDRTIPVMLCPKGDPSMILAGWQIPVVDVENTCTLALPGNYDEVDVLVGRFWLNVVRD